MIEIVYDDFMKLMCAICLIYLRCLHYGCYMYDVRAAMLLFTFV